MRDDIPRLARSIIKALGSLQEAIRDNAETVREQRKTQNDADEPKIEPIINPEVGLPPAVITYLQSQVSEQPEKDRRDRIRLRLEFGALSAAFILGIFTLLTLVQVRKQANAAQAQVEIMRTSQSAPWVGLEQNLVLPINSPQYAWSPALNYPSAYVTLQFSIKNFGNAPAFRVDSFSTFFPVGNSGPTGGPDFPDPCVMAEAQQDPSEKVQLGQVIFPGSSIPTGFGTNLTVDPQSIKTLKRVWINLCIAYQDSDKTRWHHSKYIFISSPADGQMITFPQHPGWSYLPFRGAGLIAASAN